MQIESKDLCAVSHWLMPLSIIPGVVQAQRRLLTAIAALWALPDDSLEQYLTLRKPSLAQTDSDVHVGRANLTRDAQSADDKAGKSAKAAFKQVSTECKPVGALVRVQSPR